MVVGPSAFLPQATAWRRQMRSDGPGCERAEVVAAARRHLKYDATVMAGKRWARDRFVSLSYHGGETGLQRLGYA